MTMRILSRLRATVAVGGCVAILGLTLGTANAAAEPHTVVRVVKVLPGAKISVKRRHLSVRERKSAVRTDRVFGHGYSVGGEDLTITLAAGALPSGKSAMQNAFLYRELGWQAELKAGGIDASTPVSSYTVTSSAGTVPSGAANYFHGSFIGGWSPGSDPRLDTMSRSLAVRQAQSNLATFESVLPAGSVVSADVDVMAVGASADASADEYGLAIDVTVKDAGDLAGHYGDAIVGLSTGLDSSFSNDPLEGLGIDVTAADGSPILGAWDSTRLQSGDLAFADSAAATDTMKTTTTYPDLTGVPAATEEEVGGANRLAPLARHKTVRDRPSMAAASAPGGFPPTLWAIVAALVVAGLIGVAALYRRRSQSTRVST